MNTKILRLPAVIEKTGKPRSSIYRMIRNHSFPKYIKLGKRSVGWLESEIEEWIKQCIEKSQGK